jgi:two-component system, chemotaxis family, sensor kinase CheA
MEAAYMPWKDVMDEIAQEALLLEPGNLKACGKMLKLLDKLDQPEISEPRERLRGMLEAMIMNDLEGGAPEPEAIITAVEELYALLRGKTDETDTAPDEAAQQDKTPEPEIADITGLASAMEQESPPEPPEPVIPAETNKAPEPEIVPEPVKKAPEPKKTATAVSIPDISADDEPFVIEDADLVRDFVSEAYEHLNSIEVNSVEWEKNPNNREIINSIFRPFHTIKGVSGFLNFHKINKTAHQLENLLDECREGRLQLSPELSDLIFDGVDTLKGMIGKVEQALESGEPPSYRDFDFVTLFERIAMFINCARGTVEEVEAEPVRPVEHIGEILVKSGKVTEEQLKQTLEHQAAAEEKQFIGELLVEEAGITRRDVRDAVRKQSETTTKQVAEKYIKVDTDKMDQLLDMVGELVISQSMVTQNPEILKITDQRFMHDISQLTRVTKTLQTISMSMRLVPIGATFQKMNRIVRDLTRKSGKEINLVLEGQSAEIDRNMVEELYDPLVHMIRNSCDHGIDIPANRTAKGKPAEGTIILKAEHGGGKIVITITDDGDGLNREAILKKAREKGLIGPDEEPDEKIINNMIMMPGFSTAQKITDVSGRGVGMDVVKKAIEKLRGTVEIISQKGVGTTFVIKLPLTTAIIDGMLVKVGSNRYIIPTLAVRQLVRPEADSINSIAGRGETARIRDNLIPILRLHQFLGIEDAIENIIEAVLVVVDDNGREVALQVDALLGKQEVVIKNLGEKFTGLRGVAGSAILGDGKVALILDIPSIVSVQSGNGAGLNG